MAADLEDGTQKQPQTGVKSEEKNHLKAGSPKLFSGIF